MRVRSLNLAFDGESYLSITQEDGSQYLLFLTDDQLHLLARQAMRLTFEHYNLTRPEGQS